MSDQEDQRNPDLNDINLEDYKVFDFFSSVKRILGNEKYFSKTDKNKLFRPILNNKDEMKKHWKNILFSAKTLEEARFLLVLRIIQVYKHDEIGFRCYFDYNQCGDWCLDSRGDQFINDFSYVIFTSNVDFDTGTDEKYEDIQDKDNLFKIIVKNTDSKIWYIPKEVSDDLIDQFVYSQCGKTLTNWEFVEIDKNIENNDIIYSFGSFI